MRFDPLSFCAKMKAWHLIAVALLAQGAAEAFTDFLSIGQLLSCLPVSAALCLPVCWTEQVETGRECLVERFGRYHRRLTPGWHLVCSPFEAISMRGSLREQVLDIPSQQCYTRDNAPIMADAVVYMRVLRGGRRVSRDTTDLPDATPGGSREAFVGRHLQLA